MTLVSKKGVGYKPTLLHILFKVPSKVEYVIFHPLNEPLPKSLYFFSDLCGND